MDVPELDIRPALPSDAARLAAFAERTFRHTYTPVNRASDVDAYVASHFGPDVQSAELRDPAMHTLLAFVGGALAGYAQLRAGDAPPCLPAGPALEVTRLYVDAPWHGRAVAGRLMEACIARAAAQGRTLWLGVWQHNARALRFYERTGFRIAGLQTFTMGDDVQDDYVMVYGAPAQERASRP